MYQLKDSFVTKFAMILFISLFCLGCGFPGENQWVESELSNQNQPTSSNPDSFGGGQVLQKTVDFKTIKPVLEKNCKACHTYSQDQKQFDTLVANGMVLQKVWTSRTMPKGPKANQMTDQERSLIKDYVESFLFSQNKVIQQQPTTVQNNILDSAPTSSNQETAASADLQTGAEPLQASHQESLVQNCTACHGSQGLSQIPGIPNLSGLTFDYLYTQLQAFKKLPTQGESTESHDSQILPRPDQNKDMGQIMNSILTPLSEEELRYLASYFSLFKKEISDEVLTQVQSADGPAVAMSCVGCHSGQAGAPGPLIFSQDKDYLSNQLKAFRSGERKNITMEALSQSLTDEDIETLSLFFSTLNK